MNKVISFIIFLLLFLPVHSLAQEDIATLAKQFGKLPEINNVDISPDGTKLLMLQNYQGRKILVTRSLTDPDLPLNGIPPLENQEFNWARWASNERVLAGLRFPHMNNIQGLFTFGTYETRLISMNWQGEDPVNPVAINGKRSRQSQIQDNVVDILKDEPDHILIQLDFHEQFEPGVYKIDITDDKQPLMITRGRDFIDWWQTDSNHVVRYGQGTSDRIGSNAMRYVSYYRASEEDTWDAILDFDVIKEQPPFRFEGFTDDPNVIYVRAQDENGRSALFTYDITKADFVEKIISVDGYDITNVFFDDDGNIEGYYYFDIQPQLVYVDKKKQALLDLLKRSFPGSSINFHTWSEDENIVIFEVTSPTEPGTFYIFNQEERKLEMLDYNYKDVDVEKLAEMTPITYQASDGLTIPGYLSLPKGSNSENLPTVIMPHGGPAARDNWRFDYWVQFLTAQGYAVLQMNFRGSTGYGDGFRELGKHQWGGKMISDINDGTRWMVEQGYADPERICIVGGSYGGYAALQSPIADPSLYKCSVALAPVTNLKNRVEYYKDFGDTNSYIDYIESDKYTLEEASPSLNADKINIPVLLLHGDKDRSVRVSQSQFFYNNMQSAGKDIKYIEWEDGDHFLSKEQHRVEFLHEMGLFLKKHL